MELRPKRSAHPGYHHTGGPPRAQAVPGTKTKKDLAAETKEKEKAKADGLKKIAVIERANTTAYANDETPRPQATQTSSRGHKRSKAQEPSNHQTVSPSESAYELTSKSTEPDPKNIEAASNKDTNEEQPHDSDVPSIEGPEPPTNLEHTIKKKSKGKSDVCTFIEDLKKGDEEEEEEDSSPQETPVIIRTKRL